MKSIVLKKVTVTLVASVMFFQSFSGLFLGTRSIALFLATLSSAKVYAAEFIPGDKSSWFSGDSVNAVQGMFKQEDISQEQAKQSSVDHRDKSGLEAKSGEIVQGMNDSDSANFNLLKQSYIVNQNSVKETAEFKALTEANFDEVGNVFGGGDGLCQDVMTTTPLKVSSITTEMRSCSVTAAPDIKPMDCTVERNFKAVSVKLISATGASSFSNNKLNLVDNITNSNSVQLAQNESSVSPKLRIIKASLDIENVNQIDYARLDSVRAVGKVKVTLNNHVIFEDGGTEFECSIVGGGCESKSEPVAATPGMDIKNYLVNGSNEFEVEVITITNNQLAEVYFGLPDKNKLIEYRSDTPVGCSAQTGNGVFSVQGFSVPLLNLSHDGGLLNPGTLPEFRCEDSTNSKLALGSTIQVSNENFPGLVSPLFNGDSDDEVCYRAVAPQAAYIGDVKVCDTLESCPLELAGKTFSDIAQEVGSDSSCKEIEDDQACSFTSKACLDEEGGVCQEWEKIYSCEVKNEYETIEQTSSEDCGIPVCDHDGNCTNSKEENVTNFAKVASQLSIMQFAANDMNADLDGVDVKVFKGESRTCRSMQLYGLGNNCCKGVDGVSAVNTVYTLYQVSKNQWVRDQLVRGVDALGGQGVRNSISQGYTALKDGVAETWSTIKAPFQEAYASMFESTTSGAAGSAASSATNAAGSAVTEGGIGAALEAVYQNVLGSARDFLVQDLGISEATANLFIEQTGTGQAVSYGLGAVFQMISMIYMIYTIAKLIINLITQCKKSEYETQFKAKTASCIYNGQRCTDKDFFGSCVEKTKFYCCFSSPLARIISQQGGRQIGKPNYCGGFTPDELGRMDFDKINLSEWTGYLQRSDILPTASEAAAKYDEKFMQANVANSVGHPEYSLSSDRIAAEMEGVDIIDVRKQVEEDVVVNRSALSADGATIGQASTIYDELPEVKDWVDVLIAEAKYGKNSPKIFTYKFPEEAGYRLVYSTKKPSGYPEKKTNNFWFNDDDGYQGNDTVHYGSCVNQTKDIIRKKNAGELLSIGGYATRTYDIDDDNWSGYSLNNERTWVCDYDVKIYKRVLK